MDYKEMNQILADLDQAMVTLEETYIENEGEVTEETEQMEAQISGLQDLLTTEGIDLLGGWLKAKEDKKKSLKAEKDYITRQMSAIDETIEFIKEKINQVLVATGQEKVKGDRGYSFAATTSSKTEVNKDVLKYNYDFKVEQAIRAAGVPDYVGFSLTASSTKAKEVGVQDGDEDLFVTTEKPSVRFAKPRASKEA
jgi:hypothetical protein